MNSSKIDEIKALVSLLCSEESPTNRKLVHERLLEIGMPCVPMLAEKIKHDDSRERERVEPVLMDIQGGALETEFRAWAGRGCDLEEGVFLLSRFGYPGLDVARYRESLDRMALNVRSRVRSFRKPVQVIRALNQYLFQEMGFRGNLVSYYDPDNSYLNRVIDCRTGIPITLSVVMLLLGKRLAQPLVGVGLPGHFVIRYEDEGEEIYIDSFNQGQILNRQECIRFIKEAGYEYEEGYFRTAVSQEILIRMMRNLIFVYNQIGDQRRIEWLSRYVQAVVCD